MLTIIIVDDEANSREVLELMITEKHPEVNILATASNINDGLRLIAEHQPDVVFLDIEMPGGSGFDLLKKLNPPLPEIIFCTAYGHYAIKAIECSALAYLMKPVSASRLKEALEKAQSKSDFLQRELQMLVLQEQLSDSKAPTRFLMHSAGEIRVVRFQDIVCCTADNNNTHLQLADGTKIAASKSLTEFETILSQSNFYRIHQSHIINLHFIKRVVKGDGCAVELMYGLQLDVARSKQDEFYKKCHTYKI